MKNLFFLSTVGIMMLAACSNDKDMPENILNEGTSPITISLDSGGDGLNSRAGRPVESSEAYNLVDWVSVRVCDASGAQVAGSGKILDWTAGPETPGVPGTGEHKASQSIEFSKGIFAPNTDYTIIAYGIDFDDLGYEFDFPEPYVENTWTATPKNDYKPEEVFAGAFSVRTNGNGAFPVGTEVTMKRQIAGMLGYFVNIPVNFPNTSSALTTVRYVRVYASNETTGFTFPSLSLTERINGTNPTGTRTLLLEYDLSTLITAATAGTNKAYADQVTAATGSATATFTLNEVTTATNGKPAKVANSILGGTFLHPFAKTSATTFTVELVAQNGTTVLNTWDVVTNADIDGTTQGAKVFDVKRNYFYSIGKKLKGGNLTGDGHGNDLPIDLSKESLVTVTINDAWDVIYDLGVE